MSKKMTKEEIAKQKKRERDARYRAKKREAKKQHTNGIFNKDLIGKEIVTRPGFESFSFELKLNPAVRGIFNSTFANISTKIAFELARLLNAFDDNINALIKDGLKCHGDGCEKCRKCHKKGAK